MRRGAVCGRRRGCDAAPAPHTQRTAGKGCKEAWRGAWRGRGHHVDSSGSFRGGRGQLRPSRTRGWHSLRARPPPPPWGGVPEQGVRWGWHFASHFRVPASKRGPGFAPAFWGQKLGPESGPASLFRGSRPPFGHTVGPLSGQESGPVFFSKIAVPRCHWRPPVSGVRPPPQAPPCARPLSRRVSVP